MTAAKLRLGLLGGAFDPPHRGHRRLAETALSHLTLDRLLILPTGQAWHRSAKPSDAVHRCAMARLQFDFDRRITIDDREVHRSGPSYTVDTLRELKTEFPQADMFLLIGGDQARALERWHDIQSLVRFATIVIAKREEPALATGQFDDENAVLSRLDASWHVLPTPLMPESATDIRARVARNEPIEALVGAPVAGYIAEHRLYLTP